MTLPVGRSSSGGSGSRTGALDPPPVPPPQRQRQRAAAVVAGARAQNPFYGARPRSLRQPWTAHLFGGSFAQLTPSPSVVSTTFGEMH